MKRTGILNDRLSWILARLGHGDRIVVADCGLPIPLGVFRVDLALVKGVPSFQDVVHALAEELVIQHLVVAQEIHTMNPSQYAFLRSILPSLSIEEVPHEEFKKLLAGVRAVIRTGEATPYANVILEAGVNF
jgi:D-ribose pyranase